MGYATPTLCPRFVESWLNEVTGRCHTVLGRRLRPFCAWHQFLLQAIESPLVTPGAVPSLADVETAARICRSGYRTPLARILPPAPRGRVARWWQRVRVTWTAARYPLPDATAAFDRYLRDYMAPPEFWQAAPTGAAEVLNHFPAPITLTASLITGGSFQPDNEAAAWEMPLGRAHWYSAAFAKQNGADLRLRTESDDLLDKMRSAKARYAAWKNSPKYAAWKASQQRRRPHQKPNP